jgi:hypothetical protein
LILEPENLEVNWLRLRDGAYVHVQQSELIDLTPDRLADQLVWD